MFCVVASVLTERGGAEGAVGQGHAQGAQPARHAARGWQRQAGVLQAQKSIFVTCYSIACRPDLKLHSSEPSPSNYMLTSDNLHALTEHSHRAPCAQVVLVDDKKWGTHERDLLYQVGHVTSSAAIR